MASLACEPAESAGMCIECAARIWQHGHNSLQAATLSSICDGLLAACNSMHNLQ